MSVKVSALCWRLRLPSTAKLVLMRLADYANDAGRRIFPAVGTVAEDCGLSPRAVQVAFKALGDMGVLVLERASRGGRGHTSVYSLNLIRVAELAGVAEPGEGGSSSGRANGAGHNYESGAGFSEPENRASAAGFDENPERGAQNPASAAPNPSLTVKNGGGTCAREAEMEVGGFVAGLAGMPPSKIALDRVAEWFGRGYDPKLDIYPAVVEVVRTVHGPISSFNCFTNAIGRHFAARTSPASSNVRYLPGAGGRSRAGEMSSAARDLLNGLADPDYDFGVGVLR